VFKAFAVKSNAEAEEEVEEEEEEEGALAGAVMLRE
jgi:hypothetical protein